MRVHTTRAHPAAKPRHLWNTIKLEGLTPVCRKRSKRLMSGTRIASSFGLAGTMCLSPWNIPQQHALRHVSLGHFGCGVPAAVFYFTEDTFRQIFEQQHLQEA